MRFLIPAAAAAMMVLFAAGCGLFGHDDRLQSMHEMAAACLQYASDHDLDMPMRPDSLKPDYLPESFPAASYKILLTRKLSACRHPDRTLMLCDTRVLSGGRRIVAFASGRVVELDDYPAQTRIRVLAMAALTYASYNRGRLPLKLEELKRTRLLAPDFDLSNYELCAAGGDMRKLPPETILIQEKNANRDGRWVNAIDGQVQLIPNP